MDHVMAAMEVIADSVRTGGHEWPMNTNDRINNSEETWAFLKKFSLKDGVAVQHPQKLPEQKKFRFHIMQELSILWELANDQGTDC